MVDVWKALGEVVGRAFGSVVQAITNILRFKPEMIKDIDRELASATLDEKQFKSPEIKKFVKELKVKLEGSPEGLLDWVEPAYMALCYLAYDTMIDLLLPKAAKTFGMAKEAAGRLTMLAIDFVVLTAALDVVATAFSLTLIRNLVHIGRLFIGTFGLNSFVQGVIAPAAGPMYLNLLYQGWNETSPTMIPPAPDLISMVVREAFVPEMVIEAPEVFAKYMAKSGFSKEWSDRHWTAHFIPIGLGQAYANLWRGDWTKEDFMHALHIADIHPMWREDIYNVAFRPPGVRELGYGFDTGEYSVEDIVKYRRWGGLSLEDAEKAGRAMVAYRTEAEREALRREAIADYVAGLDTEKTLREKLTSIGGNPEIVNLWVSRAQYRTDRDLTLDLVKIDTSDFIKGWSTENEYLQALIDRGVVPERRDVLIRDAKARRAGRKKEEASEKHKLLTSTKISKARELGLIGDEEFVSRHVAADYTEDDAQLLLNIELTPRPVTAAEIERRGTTITSRLNRATRRWETRLAGIQDQTDLTALQLEDAAVTRDETLDVIDAQIVAIDEELAVLVPVGPPEILAARMARIERRYELSLARIDEDSSTTAAAVTDTETIMKESLDIIDTQIAIIDEDLPVVEPERAEVLADRRRVYVERRELTLATFTARIRKLTAEVAALREQRELMVTLRDEELTEAEAMEILAVPPPKEEALRRRRTVLVQRRELTDARSMAGIHKLTAQHTNLVEEKELMILHRDEELGEYTGELELLEVAS